IANVDNLKSSSAVLVRFDGKTAVVAYKIRGLDRVLFNCPGGGHADVVVNFVVHGRRSPVSATDVVHPGTPGHLPAAAAFVTPQVGLAHPGATILLGPGITPLVHPGAAMVQITPVPH
ncbi:MAG TPA: hypothetical protein VFO24_11045, partial [Usitatibacter sp.]|nr:hypothetical protein [Usitatibacter sp.]